MVTFWQYRASRTNRHCHFLEVPFEKGIVLRWGGEDPVCPRKVLDNTITISQDIIKSVGSPPLKPQESQLFLQRFLRKLSFFLKKTRGSFFVNKCYAQKKSGDVRQQYFPRYWKNLFNQENQHCPPKSIWWALSMVEAPPLKAINNPWWSCSAHPALWTMQPHNDGHRW